MMISHHKSMAVMIALLFVVPFASQNALAKTKRVSSRHTHQTTVSHESESASTQDVPPPERANQAATFKGFSTWDIQALYGTTFREPGIHDVKKGTATLENSSAWSWGSSYFFIDYLRSDASDQHASEFYGEWYPSVSISRMFGRDYSQRLLLRDVLITMGVNAGAKDTGAAPFVFLPGLTFDLKLPWFQFFSLGAYAYMDKGRISGHGNGCNSTTYQITPSWSLPFRLGAARFRFDGFIDYIGSHGQCAYQVVSQPTIKLDLGNFSGKPDRLFAGVEWSYWRNKYGISKLDQNATQGVLMWTF
jgi:nucleoside-specific outer membrane channel protein Tsx